MSKLIRCLVAGGTLALASTALLHVQTASAGEASVLGCAPDDRTRVVQVGSPTYASIGSAAGKYNSSSASSTLSYQLSVTTSRSTTWSGTAKASIGWGIAQVEASTTYGVTKTTSTGITVTDNLVVPGKRYGYDQPKVEYRTFHIYSESLNPTCDWVKGVDYGNLESITAYPFFSSCVSTAACTPKP